MCYLGDYIFQFGILYQEARMGKPCYTATKVRKSWEVWPPHTLLCQGGSSLRWMSWTLALVTSLTDKMWPTICKSWSSLKDLGFESETFLFKPSWNTHVPLGGGPIFIFKVLQVQDCVTKIWKSIIHPLLDHTEEWQCFGWRYQNLFDDGRVSCSGYKSYKNLGHPSI